MKIEIKVPTMGESISEATVSRFLKNSGEQVNADEEIIELETDKVNQLLYSPQAGKLYWNVKIGELVKVNQVLGIVESTATVPPPSPTIPTTPLPAPTPPTTPPPSIPPSFSPSSTIPPPRRRPMSSLRRTLANKLVEAKNKTALLTTFNEVDMTCILELRAHTQEAFQKQYGVRLGLMAFFIKATALALQAFPQLHSYIDGEDFVSFPTYNIGIAVATDRGLIVPVIQNCEHSSFEEIEKQIATFAQKAREGTLTMKDLEGGSFTITNGGTFGSLLSTPLLNPPQSGILGMHTILKRPIALKDQVVIRPMMYVALSYDHRVVDGKEAIQFLLHIKEHLEFPEKLPPIFSK